MVAPSPLTSPTLPPQVQTVLNDFVASARDAFAQDLLSLVMFGSGAEGKLRPTSDVNVILVVAKFDQALADRLRQPLRFAHSAIQLQPMFLLHDEVGQAASLFASKFADILRRRVILYGPDPFSAISIPREAEILQLKRQLMNLSLRLRSGYVAQSLRDEQLARFVATAIGPCRVAAAGVLGLEGTPSSSPQAAFETLESQFQSSQWEEIRALIAAIQEARLTPGAASRVLFHLLGFCAMCLARVDKLSPDLPRAGGSA